MVELISYPPEASLGDSKLFSIKKILPEGIELSSLKKALLDKDEHVADMNYEKYVVMDKWMQIEPCLPYLVGGKRLVGVAICNDLSVLLQ